MNSLLDEAYGDVALGMECALPHLIAPLEPPDTATRASGSMIQLDARLFSQFGVVLAVVL
jgi:hypothetical protein